MPQVRLYGTLINHISVQTTLCVQLVSQLASLRVGLAAKQFAQVWRMGKPVPKALKITLATVRR